MSPTDREMLKKVILDPEELERVHINYDPVFGTKTGNQVYF